MLRNYKRQYSDTNIVSVKILCIVGVILILCTQTIIMMLVGEWILFNVFLRFKTKLLTFLSKSDRKYLMKYKNKIG